MWHLERHDVLGLAEAVEPAAAEGERAEVLVDRVQERLALLQAAASAINLPAVNSQANRSVTLSAEWCRS